MRISSVRLTLSLDEYSDEIKKSVDTRQLLSLFKEEEEKRLETKTMSKSTNVL